MAFDTQSLYVLASGGERTLELLDITTNNLSNVSTPGFKRLIMREMSQPVEKSSLGGKPLLTFPRFQDSKVIIEQGTLRRTGSKLDFAIFGEGFFTVKTESGILYTRNGHFFVNGEGFLVDQNGNQLLNERKLPIVLDPKTPFTVTQEGTVIQGGQTIGRLLIENFKDVKPAGNGYYRPSGSAVPPKFKLLRGFLEMSSVNPLKEMVNLIEAQRRFEMYGNLMRAIDSMNRRSVEIGKI